MNASALPLIRPAKQAFPSERDLVVALSPALDGSCGSNRNRTPGSVQQITAETDLEAIATWLKTKQRKSPHTLRAYKREAFRLLAWSIDFKSMPISSLSVDDVADFHTWLLTGEKHPEWERRGWELIRGPLREASAQQAMVILAGMFRWLGEAGYLAGNPFILYDDGSAARDTAQEAYAGIERLFEKELWDWMTHQIETYRPEGNDRQATLDFERSRFIVTFLYWTGLRRTEMVTATMDRISHERGRWILRVKGKGRKKLEPVILLAPAVDALLHYRVARGLPESPRASEKEIPLVAAHRGKKSVTDSYLNVVLKKLFSRLAADADPINEHWAQKLRTGSAHWLRHTLATHNAEAGVPMQDTADQLRHRSMDTTRKIYTHAKKLEKRAEGLDKLVTHSNASHKE